MQTATQILARQYQRVEQLFTAIEHERFLRAPLLRDLVEETTAYLEAERSLFRHLGARSRATAPTSAKLLRALDALSAMSTEDAAFGEALFTVRGLFQEHGVIDEGALQADIGERLSEGAIQTLARHVEAAHAAALRTQRSSAA